MINLNSLSPKPWKSLCVSFSNTTTIGIITSIVVESRKYPQNLTYNLYCSNTLRWTSHIKKTSLSGHSRASQTPFWGKT